MLATMLDPRHKPLEFLTPPRMIAAHAKMPKVLAEAEAGRGSFTSADAAGDQQEVVGAVPVQGAALQRAVLMLYSWVKTIPPEALMM